MTPRRLERAVKPFLFFTVAVAMVQSGPAQPNRTNAPSGSGQIEFNGCYARWGAGELTAGNAQFERHWVVRQGRLQAVSFRTRNPEMEWLAASGNSRPDTNAVMAVAGATGRFGPVEAESLRLEVSMGGEQEHREALQIFPKSSGVLLFDEAQSAPAGVSSGTADGEQPTGVEQAGGRGLGSNRLSSTEDLALSPQHIRLTAVTLVDQTDIHNELTSEREWLLVPSERPFQVSGVLVYAEDPLTGEGLALLKLAPLPHARPAGGEKYDFAMTPEARRVQVVRTAYPVIALAYHGGRAGRIAALQDFQRQLRVPDDSRDGIFMSNTWGDRSRDARINEEFILKEIAAGARLGLDVIDIDDGWQKGRSSNSAQQGGIWDAFWTRDPHFWDLDPVRFPNGLEPVLEAARTNGIRIGLWYAPDCSQDAANWQRDANRLLEFYHDWAVEFIFVDALNTKTATGFANERRLFDRVLNATQGRMVLDLDVTADERPGYFGMPDIGPIFLENRYTDWHRYWPHLTLRNLWELAQYVDPFRLRSEFLNNTRNTELYAGDPLAPARYRPDTLFAMTMVGNPLGWFEVSNLPEKYIDEVAPLVKTWKRERNRLHDGVIVPIGSAPDGNAWTGFASVLQNHSGGYVLLFRELNDNPEFTLDLHPLFPAGLHALNLAGRGSSELKNGRLSVRIPQTLDYLWVRLDAAK